jgi:hypothetical protein
VRGGDLFVCLFGGGGSYWKVVCAGDSAMGMGKKVIQAYRHVELRSEKSCKAEQVV